MIYLSQDQWSAIEIWILLVSAQFIVVPWAYLSAVEFLRSNPNPRKGRDRL